METPIERGQAGGKEDQNRRAEYARLRALVDLRLIDLVRALDKHERHGLWNQTEVLRDLDEQLARLGAKVTST